MGRPANRWNVNLIRTSIPEEYDFLQGMGAFPSKVKLTAPRPWGGMAFLRKTSWDYPPASRPFNTSPFDAWLPQPPNPKPHEGPFEGYSIHPGVLIKFTMPYLSQFALNTTAVIRRGKTC